MATVTIESCISDDNRKVLHNHNLDQSTFRGLKKNLSLTKRRKTRESDENSNCKRKRLAEDEFELDQRIHKNIFDLESEEADRLCSYFRKNLENSTEKRYLETICTSSSFLRLTSNLTSLSRTAAYDLLWSLVNFSAVAPENLISHLFCQTSRLLSDIRKTLSGFDVRSYLLRSNVTQLILNLQKFDEIADEQFMGTQSWALGCLLQGKNPPASHGQAICSLPRLLFLLETCNEKIQLDVLKALTSFTDFSERCDALATPNFIEKVISLLDRENSQFQQLALFISGNFLATSETYAVMLMKSGFLKRLDKKLHGKEHLKLAWWCVDSICSSDMSIFYYLATNQGFITLLIENCKRRSSIQGFAIRSLCNMIRNSDKSLVLRLAGENNLSEPIIAALSVEDQSLLASVLSSAMRLHNIIDAYDEDHAENFAQLFDELNGFEKLDNLANNCENDRNASTAALILERLQQKTGFE
ncbi:unnamed protein product [Oikopleura dioica]|uniref:Uncharacterized protein n=1 Tax=Oikopleura dioica TaxID=34765 RepID=E4X4U7_OIKDI|nr:unnamed protein product [Oikopleura dioica]